MASAPSKRATGPGGGPATADAAADAAAMGVAIRRSHLAAALAIVTEPWSNMVLREAFMGTRQFDVFQQRLGVPRQTLSLRLAWLVDIGLLRKQPHPDFAARQEYRLTARGRELHGNVLTAWLWDRRWGDPLVIIPKRLLHLRCGHAFKPLMVCEHCDQELLLSRMRPLLRKPARAGASTQAPRGGRWRSPSQDGDTSIAARDILAVIDDRWSILVVFAVMLGLQRYDQIATALGISSAVLARRLQRLCQLELLARQPDPSDARRAIYQLDKAGRELFPYLMSLSQWGGAARGTADTVQWLHVPCSHLAQGRMACSHCRHTLLPAEVRTATPRASA